MFVIANISFGAAIEKGATDGHSSGGGPRACTPRRDRRADEPTRRLASTDNSASSGPPRRRRRPDRYLRRHRSSGYQTGSPPSTSAVAREFEDFGRRSDPGRAHPLVLSRLDRRVASHPE